MNIILFCEVNNVALNCLVAMCAMMTQTALYIG